MINDFSCGLFDFCLYLKGKMMCRKWGYSYSNFIDMLGVVKWKLRFKYFIRF